MSLDPIHRSIVVARAPADAFELFTAGMGSWWPLATHSIAADEETDKAEGVIFEGRVGGRIAEVQSSGAEAEWGRVTAWEPPDRVAFDWKPNREDHPYTEVEVRFSPTADGRTLVELEHRRWEVLGPELGAAARQAYEPGWGFVFGECYGGAAG